MPRFVIALVAALLLPALVSAQTAPASDPPSPNTTVEEPADDATVGRSTGAIAYSGRSLTGPAGRLSILGGPATNVDLNGFIGNFIEPGINQIFIKDPEVCFGGFCTTLEIADPLFLVIGGTYSPLDELEIGLLALPLELSPDFEYLDPALWGRYLVVDGPWQVAVQALLFIPIDSRFVAELGAPVRFRGALRIDTGGYISFDDNGNFGLRIPATFAFNVTEALFIGGRTGISIPDLDFGDTYVPLEALVGYTLPGASGPFMDITALAGFPALLAFGGFSSDYGEVITEIFHFALGVTVHLDVASGGG